MPLTAGLIALAAACTADSPSSPSTVAPPSLNAIAATSVPCEPSQIRRTMATLFTTSDMKKGALPTLNAAEGFKKAGDPTSARNEYFELIAFTIERYVADALQAPSSQDNVQAGVHYVIAAVATCAGDAYPDGLERIIDAMGMDHPDYQICVAVNPGATSIVNPANTNVFNPATGGSCVVPSLATAVSFPAGYFSKAALILMEPKPDAANAFSYAYGSLWSGVWRVAIAPIDAQANYPTNPATDVGPGSAALCALKKYDDFHPDELAPMRVAHDAEASTTDTPDLLPTLPVADLFAINEFLDCEYARGVPRPVLGQTASSSFLSRLPFGDSYAARQGWRALRGAGDAVSRYLTPQSLYAWDGGIGGAFSALESYLAGVEEPALVYRLNESETEGALQPFSLPTGGTETVHVSRTRFGTVLYPFQAPLTPAGPLVEVADCEWSSSHNRVSFAPMTNNAIAVLTASNSAGEATVTATCTYWDVVSLSTVTSSVSILVTVFRP